MYIRIIVVVIIRVASACGKAVIPLGNQSLVRMISALQTPVPEAQKPCSGGGGNRVCCVQDFARAEAVSFRSVFTHGWYRVRAGVVPRHLDRVLGQPMAC
jgi:hypothetical protein